MSKPLVIGMGPSPIPQLTGHPWHPLAPTTLCLAKIVFDNWLALPELESRFDLQNLNEVCHQERGRDVVDRTEASRTMRRLVASGAFANGRHVIVLGRDVERHVLAHRDVCKNANILFFYHPSCLSKPWSVPRQHWSDMRRQIRLLLNLPDIPTEIEARPTLVLTDYPRDVFLGYLKRYKVDLRSEYVGRTYQNDVIRDLKEFLMSIPCAEEMTSEPLSHGHGTYSNESFDDVEASFREVLANDEEGWPYPDEDPPEF